MRIGEADKNEKRRKTQKAAQLRDEVRKNIDDNQELFDENVAIINRVWKEYSKVLFFANNENEIEGKIFLSNPDMSKEEKIKLKKQLEQKLDKLIEYYIGHINENIDFPNVSGNRQIDYVIHKLKNMNYSEFLKEITKIEEKDNVKSVIENAGNHVSVLEQEEALKQIIGHNRVREGQLVK